MTVELQGSGGGVTAFATPLRAPGRNESTGDGEAGSSFRLALAASHPAAAAGARAPTGKATQPAADARSDAETNAAVAADADKEMNANTDTAGVSVVPGQPAAQNASAPSEALAGSSGAATTDTALLLAQNGLVPSALSVAHAGSRAVQSVASGITAAIDDAPDGDGAFGLRHVPSLVATPGPAAGLAVADAAAAAAAATAASATMTAPAPGLADAAAAFGRPAAVRSRAGAVDASSASVVTDAFTTRNDSVGRAVVSLQAFSTAALQEQGPSEAPASSSAAPHTPATLLQQRAAAQDAAAGLVPASGSSAATATALAVDTAFAATSALSESQGSRRRERTGGVSSEAGGAAANALVGSQGVTSIASALMAPADVGGATAQATTAGASERLLDQFGWWMAQKTQNAELTLDIGGQPVSVSVKVQGNEAQVMFRSDAPDARQMLAHTLPQLKEMLGSEGMVLADATVGGQPAGGGRSATGDGRGDTPAPAKATATAIERNGARSPLTDIAAPAAAPRRDAGPRSLDLYV